MCVAPQVTTNTLPHAELHRTNSCFFFSFLVTKIKKNPDGESSRRFERSPFSPESKQKSGQGRCRPIIDGGLHGFPAWCWGVILPGGRNLDVDQVNLWLSLLKWRAQLLSTLVQSERGNSFGQPCPTQGLHDGEGWCSGTLCVVGRGGVEVRCA